MMKSLFYIPAVLVSCFFSVAILADVVQKQALSFSAVDALTSDIDDLDKTVLVIDFQDTLAALPCDFTSPSQEKCPYLGSAAWFNWQRSLLEKEPDSQYLVAKDELSLLEIASIILTSSQLVSPEALIPQVLESLGKQGARIMFMTKYDRNQRLTERAALSLVLNEQDKTSLGDLLHRYSPRLEDSHNALAVCNESEASNISYQNGVLYTAGQNTSSVSKCFFELYNTQLSKALEDEVKEGAKGDKVKEVAEIVFIDDSYSNIEELYSTYRSHKELDAFLLHYVALDSDWKNLFSDGHEAVLQEQAHQKWLTIKDDVMSQIFVK